MKALIVHGAGSGATRREETPRRAARRSSLLRTAGRVALWACVALVFVRGLGAILSSPQTTTAPSSSQSRPAAFPDGDARAFAVAFARVYLTVEPGREIQHARAVGSYLAQGLSDQAAVTVPPRSPGAVVAQAMVAREIPLGGSRALVTVAALMSSGRIVYLTVPVARDGDGGLVVDDLPAFSAPSPRGGAPVHAPAPLTDADAEAIADLADRFLRAYLEGAGAGALAYFLEPGVRVASMPPGLRVASIGEMAQEPQRGPGSAISAVVRVRDETTRAAYTLRYRLTVIERDRWYVQAVVGGPSA